MTTSVKSYVPRRTWLVWASLIALTLITGTFGTSMPFAHSVTTAVVLAIALVKVRLIGTDFMELRRAPRPLAAAFDVYLVVVYCGLVGMYLVL